MHFTSAIRSPQRSAQRGRRRDATRQHRRLTAARKSGGTTVSAASSSLPLKFAASRFVSLLAGIGTLRYGAAGFVLTFLGWGSWER
jgi:hypothetical protein